MLGDSTLGVVAGILPAGLHPQPQIWILSLSFFSECPWANHLNSLGLYHSSLTLFYGNILILVFAMGLGDDLIV